MTSSVLLSNNQIQESVKAIAKQVEAFYKDRKWTAVIVYNGAVFFAADLLKEIDSDFKIAGVQASSYKGGFNSGELSLTGNIDCKDQHILIIDDIYDTGKTLSAISREFYSKGALTVECCVLLTKDCKKDVPIDVMFSCFTVPNKFLFGYGLDINNKFRNLKDIFVYESH